MTIKDATQTATVSDKAVQSALDKWFGADPYEYKKACFDDMLITLTAALPYLALSAAPCSIEAKKLPCDVQLPGAIFKRGVSISTLITALERREHWPEEDTHLTAKPVDVAAVREQALAVLRDINIHEEVEGYEWRGDGDYMPNDQEKALLEDFGGGLIGRVEEVILALSPAEPVDQWQDIATASKDGTEFLTWNGRRQHVARFDKVENAWVSSFTTVTKRLPLSPQPTHFAPLPAAPTSKGDE